ncbi:RHS repeat-associated core domain-containing protein [Alkaliphilus hydrothermalis]|uniref:RHS repeat-associated protein n=1 Tax=Alkaliphilus hydrothermalis TaxID=1482730 RepID=A0ABS2NQ81_9FIRM|nr:RHS repeat-associated core domain-containing protein [Alkaliphilus hydrothermalis]MBM7615097.1 RHS repeat-associated protein [Alkaliphilus hydrothermalis]
MGKTTNYTYDVLGRLDTVSEGSSLLATYTYNVDNTIATINYNTGINITYGYDRDKNITSILQKDPQGGVINNLTYTYDLRGNQLSKDENNETTIYTYDKVNRLKTVEYPTAAVESFTYDNAGNRTQKQLGQDTTTYEYDSRNRLTKSMANDIITTYDYDNNGNLLTETTGTEITSYTYDGFNRTLGVEKPNGSYQYNHYDAMGLRVGMTENGVRHEFIFSGGNVVGEINSNTEAFTKYVRGYGLVAMEDPKGNTNYYLNNEHGDVINLVKGTGEILNDYQYDAFGNTTSYTEKVANRFRYAGEQFDNITGQYYLRARYYDPEIGRFTQEDTYRGDGLNLYAYVSNNPVRYVDPSGNEKAPKSSSKGNFALPVLGSNGEPLQLAYNGNLNSSITTVASVSGVATASTPAITIPITQYGPTILDTLGRVIYQIGPALNEAGQIIAQHGAQIMEGIKNMFSETSDDESNSDRGTKTVDDVLKDATPGRNTKGKAKQFEKSGDYDDALNDFNDLGPIDVKDIPGGKVGKLPDGRTINVRNKSSDGRPTLEIYDGKSSIKIRYGN